MRTFKGLHFHEARAEEVLNSAMVAYAKRTHLYTKYHASRAPQQTTWPEGMLKGSKEHVLYLFLTTLVTLQSNSDEGFSQARSLYEKYPECFTEEAVRMAEMPPDHPQHFFVFLDEEEVSTSGMIKSSRLSLIFGEAGFNKPKPWAHHWGDTVQSLFEDYGGDPIALIREVKTVDGFLARKKQKRKEGRVYWFNGMGPKLFSLFCIFCEELGLIDPIPDAFPADVHIQRIALGTGIVTADQLRVSDTGLAELLRTRFSAFGIERWGSVIDLSHALWFLGRQGCKPCAGISDLGQVCPVATLCKGSPNTHSYWKRGRWELDSPWNAKGTMNTLLTS